MPTCCLSWRTIGGIEQQVNGRLRIMDKAQEKKMRQLALTLGECKQEECDYCPRDAKKLVELLAEYMAANNRGNQRDGV